MNKSTIMVSAADREWTLDTLRSACQLARQDAATIVLVQMIPVQHSQWLGTEFGYFMLSPEDQADFSDYEKVLEASGLEYEVVIFQYHTLLDATVEVANSINAQVVFARVTDSALPLWKNYQTWSLRRMLARSGRTWIEHAVDNADTLPSSDEVMLTVKAH